MNTYGQYTDLVQEVADFAYSGKLLDNLTSINDDSVIIELDFEAAVERARTQGQDDEMDENWLPWLAIREHELSEFYLSAPEASMDKELNASIHELSEIIRQCVQDHLPEAYVLALNDIHGDLSSCARSRAYVGDQNPFFEKLFNFYKTGAWPCGWEGNYPNGKLVVFVPSS